MFSKLMLLVGALGTALATPVPGSVSSNDTEHHSLQARAIGGNVVFANRCFYDVWIWSVSPGFSTPPIRVPARTRYTERKRAPASGGVVLKVSKSNQLLAGRHTQFEYSSASNVLYYDISLVDCAVGQSGANCPGWGSGLQIEGFNPNCRKVTCPSNSYCPHQAYFVDRPVQKLGIPEPVFGCGNGGTGMDVYFRVCSKNAPVP